MIVDTSALIAILRDEPDAALMARALVDAEFARLSTTSFVEAVAVIDGKPRTPLPVAVTTTCKGSGHLPGARDRGAGTTGTTGLSRFRQGQWAPCAADFGDCFAYALARDLAEPLLFKGTDFAATDIEPALGRIRVEGRSALKPKRWRPACARQVRDFSRATRRPCRLSQNRLRRAKGHWATRNL